MALTTVPASLSATALTLTTAAQPNITSVGTLTGLTVSGNIAGTLTTAAQTNITSVGTLSSLSVGAITSTGKLSLNDSTYGGWIQSNTSVRIDIDNDNNQTDRAFVVSKNNGATSLLTLSEDTSATFAGAITAGSNITSGNDVYVPNGRFFRFTGASSSSSGGFLFGDSSGTGGSIAFKRNSDSASVLTLNADQTITTGGDVGIGTSNPGAKLHIDPGTDFSQPTLIINSPSTYSEGDLYVLHGRNVNSGLGFSSTAFGVNVNGTLASDNIPHLRSNTGGLTSAGVMYVGADEVGQGVFGVMGVQGSPGADLNHLFTVMSSGNVGIGSTDPAGLLTIRGTGDAIRVESTNTGVYGAQLDLLHHTTSPADDDVPGAINFGGYYSGTNPAYSAAIRSVWTDVSARDGKLAFFTREGGTFDERMTIINNGNIGIGETSPDWALDVRGANSGVQLQIGRSVGGSTGTGWFGADGSGIHIGPGTYSSGGFSVANPALKIASDGDVGIGTATPLGRLHVKEGSSGVSAANTNFDQLILEDDLHSGMSILSGSSSHGAIYFGDSSTNDIGQIKYRHDSNQLDFTTNGQIRMIINNNGEVGINDTPPTNNSKLTVGGAINQAPGYWSYGNLLRRLSISGPSGSGTFTRTINVATQLKFNAQGGGFMYMLHGWMSDGACGFVHFRNNGSGDQTIIDVYQHVYTAQGITVTASKGTGATEIDFDISSAHSNTHGWYFVLWWQEKKCQLKQHG